MQEQAVQKSMDLECRGVTKTFGEFKAVDHVSFAIPRGSFFSILGPSGCGKTTLLRMLAGFQQPDTGDILIKGASVLNTAPNRRPVNMVFQHLALFPNMTVADNVAYGLVRRKVNKSEIKARVDDMLQRVGLPDAGAKQVSQLSGGQKQRIAIARCLVLNPDVLLLDEPLGALDLKLREQMKVELKQLQEKFEATFVYITHDQSEALVMSDQVAVMNHGRFEQIGTPQELYYEPSTRFVTSFVGESNHWQGVVEEAADQTLLLKTDAGMDVKAQRPGKLNGRVTNTWQKGQKVEVFLRPESVSLALGESDLNTENQFTGYVESVLFDGARSQLLVRVEAKEVLHVSLPQTSEFRGIRKGDVVSVGWSATQMRCYEV